MNFWLSSSLGLEASLRAFIWLPFWGLRFIPNYYTIILKTITYQIPRQIRVNKCINNLKLKLLSPALDLLRTKVLKLLKNIFAIDCWQNTRNCYYRTIVITKLVVSETISYVILSLSNNSRPISILIEGISYHSQELTWNRDIRIPFKISEQIILT